MKSPPAKTTRVVLSLGYRLNSLVFSLVSGLVPCSIVPYPSFGRAVCWYELIHSEQRNLPKVRYRQRLNEPTCRKLLALFETKRGH